MSSWGLLFCLQFLNVLQVVSPTACKHLAFTQSLMTKAQYLLWFDDVVRPTEPIFRRVPAEKLTWKLTESSFSVGQLLCHIPLALKFSAKVLNNEEVPLRSLREIFVANRNHRSTSVEQAIDELHAARERFVAAVHALSEEQFQAGVLDTPQMGRTHYWRYGAFVLEHHIHHLMELHLNLKVLGIPVDTKTLYGG